MSHKSSTKGVEIAGYVALPIEIPSALSSTLPDSVVTHYVYLRRHEPRIPDPDASRSLFLVNVPIDTTELHLRHLFSSQLSAGRVERVHFEDVFRSTSSVSSAGGASSGLIAADGNISQQRNNRQNNQQSKKRKRENTTTPTSQELEAQLRSAGLPSTWDRELHTSGSHAIVVFVDQPAMEASLKAARKFSSAATLAVGAAAATAASRKKKAGIVWGSGIEDRVPALGGSNRYRKHTLTLRYPNVADLLNVVNEYMSLYTQMEEMRAAESARRAAEPDEDGFITVTRGPRFTDVAREEEVRELVEKQRKREEGLGDFYRFQTREKRKERQNQLVKRFEQDRMKIDRLKRSRGRIMPEGV